MRILLTCRGVLPWNEKLSGGQELYVMRLAQHLAMRKHDVHVVANCPDSVQHRLAREGISVHQSRPPIAGSKAVMAGFYGWLWAHLWGNVAVSLVAARVHRQHHFDVVHCHGALSLLMISGRAPELPIVYTCHDAGPWLGQYPPFERFIRKRIFSLVDARAMKTADHVVVCFDRMKDHLLERWAIGSEACSAVKAGVDLDTFSPPAEADKRDGVVFIGQISRRKGADLLIPLAQRTPGLKFTVLGDGPDRAALEQRCMELGLSERLRFLGAKANSDVRNYLVRARALVMPSRSEGIPLTILESFSCATPVAAFKAGGIGDVVKDSWNGFLAEVGDIDTLERGLRTLALGDPGLSASLGQNGRRMIEEAGGWHAVAGAMEDIYATAIRAHSARLADAAPYHELMGS